MLDYRMKILALRVYRIYFLQQKLDCNMYLLTYNLSELVFHKISAMQSLRYLSNKYYLLRSLCLHLLCEVTINSICKNFFFHPHMHIESKKAYISDICFRMQSEIQQMVKLQTIDFILECIWKKPPKHLPTYRECLYGTILIYSGSNMQITFYLPLIEGLTYFFNRC